MRALIYGRRGRCIAARAAQDTLLEPLDVLPLAPLLGARAVETWAIEAPQPFSLPAFALESPLMSLATMSRLTSLTLHYLTEDAAADADAWGYLASGLPHLRSLRVGLCTAWTEDVCAAVGRLHRLELLGLTGLPVTSSGAAALAAALGGLVHLRDLTLVDFACDDGAGARARVWDGRRGALTLVRDGGAGTADAGQTWRRRCDGCRCWSAWTWPRSWA